MPSTIRAAVCRAFGAPLQIETLTLRDPGPGEIEVTIEAVAICHSDISYMEGAWGGPLPAVYGHEAAGRVTALGPGVTQAALGDRVLVTLIRACGACPDCARGQPVYCFGNETRAPKLTDATGAPVHAAMECGAFAEKAVVDQSQVARLGEAIAPEAACLLACGVPTGVGAAVNTARVRPGDIVVVIGAGGVGLNAIQGARLAGAARIVAMDLEPKKLDDARAFGATDTILATEPKPWKILQKITGGRLATHVLVTVGAIPAYDVALRLMAPGGTACAIGMPHSGATSAYEPVILAALGQGLRGTKMGDVVLARDIPWMVDLHAQGRLKLEELISRRWPFDQINAAIADTNTGQARRNVLTLT
ncbi:alcohol dehydrogenase catalytic domain-containing protein [Roseicyclus persicicus]|uniref:Alcohol dehydrogenase catalytic domain-containing protein n=1 Tax=Roseicyclus persicicus TaxID=2650661 RepID=A0A7X6H3S2_9RHOB|nr:alcohol dehydrogenase catalytic domain-containing protein [Roseibacterium persicicum]NKX46331.1 alcohol dehydrogenase catalytic domain-containing protein [Roseibacterium persicicum]